MSSQELPFWEVKSLAEMSHAEWESLCDGCGQCCLVKLEDIDSGSLYVTNVSCRLLDTQTCRCSDYAHRQQCVENCLVLAPGQVELVTQLPQSCAYRCLAEQRPLPDWHPLVCGDRNAVHQQGVSVRDYAISEEYIHPGQLELHIMQELD